MVLFFYLSFFFLLMLYISLYDIFIYSHRANKISTRPEMITPVRLLFHLRVTFKQLDCQFAFQYSHHLRNRYLGWNRQHKMNVVILNTHFENLTFLPFTQLSYILFYQHLDLSSQYPKPIFGHPNNMIITLIYNMRQFLVLTHVTNIGIATRTLPPSKTVGF